MTDYWLSWYNGEDLSEFELHSPWWISGYAFDPDRDIICAAIRAENEDAAWEQVRNSYDSPPAEIEQRFCDELEGSPFSGRFPQGNWMVWEDNRTCNCPKHKDG